jgi:dTDP-4-amino-4,6-dideoxygalactose transaminase
MRPVLPNLNLVEPYLKQMVKNGTYSNFGPLNQELERRYAEYLGVDPKQVVSCANATIALQGCIELLPPKKWISPSFTFAATNLAVLNSGKELVNRDISLSDWTIELQDEDYQTDRGVMLVLPFGSSFHPDSYRDVDYLVIDAAASLGNTDNFPLRLKETWVAVFSLHATKVFGIGEGGFVVFGSESLARRFRSWTAFGFMDSRESVLQGTNAKLSEISAAFGLAAIDNRETEISEWNQSRKITNAIEANLGIKAFSSKLSGVNPYWIIRTVSKSSKLSLNQDLREEGIESRDWWQIWTNFKPTEDYRATFPNSFDVLETSIGLPFSRNLSPDYLEHVQITLERYYI